MAEERSIKALALMNTVEETNILVNKCFNMLFLFLLIEAIYLFW